MDNVIISNLSPLVGTKQDSIRWCPSTARQVCSKLRFASLVCLDIDSENEANINVKKVLGIDEGKDFDIKDKKSYTFKRLDFKKTNPDLAIKVKNSGYIYKVDDSVDEIRFFFKAKCEEKFKDQYIAIWTGKADKEENRYIAKISEDLTYYSCILDTSKDKDIVISTVAAWDNEVSFWDFGYDEIHKIVNKNIKVQFINKISIKTYEIYTLVMKNSNKVLETSYFLTNQTSDILTDIKNVDTSLNDALFLFSMQKKITDSAIYDALISNKKLVRSKWYRYVLFIILDAFSLRYSLYEYYILNKDFVYGELGQERIDRLINNIYYVKNKLEYYNLEDACDINHHLTTLYYNLLRLKYDMKEEFVEVDRR